ncbi:MAG: hypothetical protein ACRDJ4_12030 [Actinomycetota bacterium]
MNRFPERGAELPASSAGGDLRELAAWIDALPHRCRVRIRVDRSTQRMLVLRVTVRFHPPVTPEWVEVPRGWR